MKKNHMILIIVLILVFLGVFLAFLSDYGRPYIDSEDVLIKGKTLNVSSEGPMPLSDIIDDIRTSDYYEGYDKDTVKWMESLGDKYVFSSEDAFVVMDKWDADKIPSIYACDVSLYEVFKCDVIDRHQLGDVDYPKDVIYVRNVEYIREYAVYYDV